MRATCSARQLVAPGAGLAAAEEVSAGVRPRRLAKALVLLLLPQFARNRQTPPRARSRPRSPARRAKASTRAQYAGGVGLHVLIAHEMDRNVASARASSRRGRSSPAASGATDCAGGSACTQKRGLLVVHEGDRLVDAAAVVVGERGRHVARIAHDDDGRRRRRARPPAAARPSASAYRRRAPSRSAPAAHPAARHIRRPARRCASSS